VIVIDTGSVRTEMRARQLKNGSGSSDDEVAAALADLIDHQDPPALAQVG
jgi:hypothetical protein